MTTRVTFTKEEIAKQNEWLIANSPNMTIYEMAEALNLKYDSLRSRMLRMKLPYKSPEKNKKRQYLTIEQAEYIFNNPQIPTSNISAELGITVHAVKGLKRRMNAGVTFEQYSQWLAKLKERKAKQVKAVKKKSVKEKAVKIYKQVSKKYGSYLSLEEIENLDICYSAKLRLRKKFGHEVKNKYEKGALVKFIIANHETMTSAEIAKACNSTVRHVSSVASRLKLSTKKVTKPTGEKHLAYLTKHAPNCTLSQLADRLKLKEESVRKLLWKYQLEAKKQVRIVEAKPKLTIAKAMKSNYKKRKKEPSKPVKFNVDFNPRRMVVPKQRENVRFVELGYRGISFPAPVDATPEQIEAMKMERMKRYAFKL